MILIGDHIIAINGMSSVSTFIDDHGFALNDYQLDALGELENAEDFLDDLVKEQQDEQGALRRPTKANTPPYTRKRVRIRRCHHRASVLYHQTCSCSTWRTKTLARKSLCWLPTSLANLNGEILLA